MTHKKPDHLKLIDGNPGKRPIAKKSPPTGAPLDPTPPKWLSTGARMHWKRAVGECAEGVLQAVDAPILAAWAAAVDRMEKLDAEFAKRKKLTYTTDSGTEHVTPLMAALRSQSDLVVKLARQLGFTPATRDCVAVTRPDSNKNNPFSKYTN